MGDVAAEQAPIEQPRPGAAKTITFMVSSFALRLVQFVLVVTLALVGIATTVIWVGIPILMLTTSLVRGFGDLERRWVRKILGTPLPDADRAPVEGGMLRRWRTRLVDGTTWRDLSYLLLALPLGIIEFAVGIASIILVPMAIWVAPWFGWMHGSLAVALLGPNRTEKLRVKAQQLQASRARGGRGGGGTAAHRAGPARRGPAAVGGRRDEPGARAEQARRRAGGGAGVDRRGAR